MQPAPHHNAFTVQDIERYHRGEMSPAEMHQLEKAALDDPFLADALEGYTLTATPVQDVALLQESLAERTKGKTKVLAGNGFPWLRVAAMLVLLAGIGWLVYRLSNTTDVDIAKNSTPAEQQETAADSFTTAPTSTSPNTTTSTVSPEQESNPNAPVTTERKNKKTVENAAQQIPTVPNKAPADAQLSNSIAAFQDSTARLQSTARMKRSNAPAADNRIIAMSAPVQAPNINGRVVDVQNNAVPHAVISNEKKTTATTADAEGNFSIASPDSVIEVAVYATGYAAGTTALLQNNAQNKVVLQPATRNTNKATGIKEKNESGAVYPFSRISIEGTEPIDGWEAFNRYLANQPPTSKIDNQQLPHGEVQLSFETSKEGKAINIVVERSLCTPCDAAAIRLLQHAPAWKKSSAQKAKASVFY